MKTVYVPDIECDSCVKLISRSLKKNDIKDFKIDNDGVTVPDAQEAIAIIKKLGYRASTEPFERKTFKERVKHYKENKQAYAIEIKGLKNTIRIFFSLLALAVLAYFALFQNRNNFLSTYGWWVFYLILSITFIATAVWHFYAYRAKVTCMTGMMIGMTFGMQTGMMLGAIIGATNGFFWGAMTGMILGTSIGLITGKCCGIMGLIEGAMAGMMGGTMGPMITVMMFSDNVLWFMPLYMIINIGIIIGLSYMLYEELVEGKEVKKQPLDSLTLVATSIIITAVLVVLMVYGPTSSLIRF